MEQTEQSRQNEIIISLMGRLTFPEEVLKKIISKSKQNPAAYIKGYNSCDGEKGVTEIAKIVGVSQPTMTYILQSWKVKGIVYQKGKNYMRLYNLIEDREEKNDKRKPVDGEINQADGPDSSSNVEEPRGGEQNNS